VDVKIKAVVVTGVLTAGMLLASGPVEAAAAPVTCGSVLEADAYLTQDLRCPAGNGIFLEIDVTLDLRGHRLIGPGATADVPGSGIAVTLSPAWPSKVINGTIKDWPVAIGGNEDFETVETATLEDLTLTDNGTAVLANQADLTINRTTFRRNAVAVNARSWGELGTRLSVTGSTFRDNDLAVQVDSRTTATLRDNTFRANGVGYTVTAGDPDGYNALLAGNTFTANGDAVRVSTPGTSLGGNTALRNSGWGIYAPGAIDLGGNVARKNGNNPQCVGVAC
jgi:parallel beta helix pectate lyase-like protein